MTGTLTAADVAHVKVGDWLGACRLDERGDVWQLRDDGRWYCADPTRTDFSGWRGWEPLAGDPVRMTRKVTVRPVGGE